MAESDSAVKHPTDVIPRRLLSLVLRIDVTFTRPQDTKTKEGQGSGFPLAIGGPPGFGIGVGLKELIAEAIEHLPPFVYVTCRHVVDYAYQHKGEYGWSLSSFTVRCFNEEGARFPSVDFPLSDLCVLVPKNKKLDLALIAVRLSSVGLRTMIDTVQDGVGRLSAVNVAEISPAAHLCSTMPWGTEVGFTSIQPWTHGYPILRSGRVASDPKVDFCSPDIDKDDIYLLEAQSFAGSSGAPVVSYPIGHPVFNDFRHGDGSHFEKYRRPHLVGIMSGHISNVKSGELQKLPVGLSYCHKTSALQRMISVEDLEQL